MDEVYQQIEEITQRLDDQDSAQQDFSDTVDSNLADIQGTIDDQASSIDDLTQTQGQLQFPLTQETIDLINEIFPRGTVTLSSGSATIKDGRISTNSIILHSVLVENVGSSIPIGGGPHLVYSVTITNGQAVFNSSISTDASTLGYLILTSQ